MHDARKYAHPPDPTTVNPNALYGQMKWHQLFQINGHSSFPIITYLTSQKQTHTHKRSGGETSPSTPSQVCRRSPMEPVWGSEEHGKIVCERERNERALPCPNERPPTSRMPANTPFARMMPSHARLCARFRQRSRNLGRWLFKRGISYNALYR